MRTQLLIGATLPQLFALAGGLWLWSGDVRGKRLVVFGIVLRLIYSVADFLLVTVDSPGASAVPTAFAPYAASALALVTAAVLYALVGTMQFGEDTGRGRVILSRIVTVGAWLGLLVYAGLLIEL